MIPVPSARAFTRMPVHVAAEVHAEADRVATGRVSDVSMNGIGIETADAVEPGTHCRISLVLGAGDSPVRIKLTAHVVRWHEGVLACAIETIDPNGYEHFLNLLLYNAPDARAFEEEIDVRADLQPTVAPADEPSSPEG